MRPRICRTSLIEGGEVSIQRRNAATTCCSCRRRCRRRRRCRLSDFGSTTTRAQLLFAVPATTPAGAMDKRIGFIGAGQMAEALARAFIAQGVCRADQIFATDV